MFISDFFPPWWCFCKRFTRRVIKAFAADGRLKVIHRWGTGYDSVDVDAARDYGIKVLSSLLSCQKEIVFYQVTKEITKVFVVFV